MEINGVTLDLDLDDLEVAQKARDAVAEAQKQLDGLQESTDYVTGAKKVCETVNDCFDSIFGDGTSEKIFEGMRFTPHIDAFVTLGEAVYGSMEAIGKNVAAQNDRMQAVYAKYRPSRTDRRHPAKRS